MWVSLRSLEMKYILLKSLLKMEWNKENCVHVTKDNKGNEEKAIKNIKLDGRN